METLKPANCETMINRAIESAVISLICHSRWPKQIIRPYSWRQMEYLRADTKGKCVDGCLSAAIFLAKNKNTFANLFLLTATALPNLPESYFHKKYDMHCFLVILGVDGVIYAISPANYDPTIAQNTLTLVHKAKNIENLISVIKSTEGGIWPKSEDIESNLATLPQFKIESNRDQKIIGIPVFLQGKSNLSSLYSSWRVIESKQNPIMFEEMLFIPGLMFEVF